MAPDKELGMDDLVDTVEMYLKSVLEMEEEGVPPIRARIAERLDQAVQTVSGTVARMERDGLVTLPDGRSLELTPLGRSTANSIMLKHRLAERLLVDVIGLDWEDAHIEACRWEHVMSDRAQLRLDETLNHPTASPYGNPISHRENEQRKAVASATSLTRVATAERERGVRVEWIGEPLQVDRESLAALRQAGVLPGGQGSARRIGPDIRVEMSAHAAVDLPVWVATHVFVSPR